MVGTSRGNSNTSPLHLHANAAKMSIAVVRDEFMLSSAFSREENYTIEKITPDTMLRYRIKLYSVSS